ncbi:MAG: hypothetical protein P1V35_06660 [Planctomycetota bacterium]|nr:hypothetical protein [Planctomycetota bacterium]
MSTIQRSKVKTLSDQAELRSAHRADQAIYGRPVDSMARVDIDNTSGEIRPAVAGAHGTDSFLFDDMQATETRGQHGHSKSKRSDRMGAHPESVVRDRRSSRTQVRAGKGIRQSGGPSMDQGATPSVMIAELPFATSATADNAGERKLRRHPDAGPYRGMRMPRRSSLPTFPMKDTCMGLHAPVNQTPAIALRGMPQTAKVFVRSTGDKPKEWRESFQGNLTQYHSDFANHAPSDQDSPFQRLSQVLAKPEVGGYLVMGALIACTFLI